MTTTPKPESDTKAFLADKSDEFKQGFAAGTVSITDKFITMLDTVLSDESTTDRGKVDMLNEAVDHILLTMFLKSLGG